MKRLFIFFTTVVCILTVSAQSKRQVLKKMGTTFYQEDFKEVLDMSVQFEKDHPKETDHLYYKYIAELLTIDRGGDIQKLFDFEASKGKTDKFYNYWLGRIHLSRYEFDDAKEHLDAFMKLDVYKSNIILKETRAMLRTIEKARPFYDNPDDYEVERLPEGINTIYSEISPAFFNGHEELVFASNKNPKDSYHEAPVYSIYHSVKTGEKWSEPSPISVLGTFDYENAKIEIINEDNRLYMYSPQNGGDLIYSEFRNNSWSEPKEFDQTLRDRYIENHFFINDAEDLILFVKDYNIWETRLQNGAWSAPKPIKGKVNTSYYEESPFLSHSGTTLYFSSNRPESMGGYDIFKSELDEATGSWGEPENMGFPINTIDHDINFEVTPNDLNGYFSSDRLHSVGGYDLYYFHKEDKITVKGVVTDLNTGQPAKDVDVRFMPIVYEDEVFHQKTNAKGEYSIKVFNGESFDTEVAIQGESLYKGTFKSDIALDQPHLTQNFEVRVPTQLKAKTDYTKLYEGTKEDSSVDLDMLGNKFRGGRKAVVNNIYFDFQSYHITSDSYPVLQQIYDALQNSPDLAVEIGGHTDNVGTHEYNMELSQKRAEAVRDWILNKGIDSSRVKAVGYGETLPLASNDDEENGRELNRRIEIRVLE